MNGIYNPNVFVSRKNEKVCITCQHTFNAWEDTGRKQCYLCDPILPVLARQLAASVHF